MARKKGKGRSVKGARRKYGIHYESDDIKQAPHTMIFNRGHVNKPLRRLVKDMRNVMEPYTATNLKALKKNSLKDFVSIAGPLHVTHLLIFTETDVDGYLKVLRLPRGPTLHFKIENFSLCKDIVSSLKRSNVNQKQFLYQPLLILNGFHLNHESGEPKMHHKLMATMFQNMFPSINVTKIELNEIKRCVLINFNADDETIDFRHYNIKLKPVGLSKPVKKLIDERIPDLSNLHDISEFFEKSGILSESEAELDTNDNQVIVPEKMQTNEDLKNTKNAIRLTEIGPRLKLKLIKIQEGLQDGEVLYHFFMNKTPEELQQLRDALKLKKKEAKKSRPAKLQGSNKKNAVKKSKKEKIDENTDDEGGNDVDVDETDADYYKKEIGKDPDADFFVQKRDKSKRKQDQILNEQMTDDYLKNKKPDDDEIDIKDYGDKNKKQKLVRFEEPQIKAPKTKFLRFSNKKKNLQNSNK